MDRLHCLPRGVVEMLTNCPPGGLGIGDDFQVSGSGGGVRMWSQKMLNRLERE